ncbi:hypothetical protein D210916BOD24_02180 [Alteromonas sp. D210916BOD_24]|uniref:hypothetical protein n=1 Tax=Alteromonas sp. D210916BOD_24 TaxID=3157618 RepID=UPI00399D0B77
MRHSTRIILASILSVSTAFSYANQLDSAFMRNEINLAYQQYMTGSPESAMYALETLTRLLESDQSPALLNDIGPNTLGMTYARLGILHENFGDSGEAEHYRKEAIKCFKSSMNDVSWDGIKAAVHTLDSPRS